MKAFEVMAILNNYKQLILDEQLDIDITSRVKVIIIVSDDNKLDSDDTPIEHIKNS